ncbi:MAG TPA: DNA mismatch repair protein MutS, partial [Ruminococcus flavefaciens]|nr:DNA mismatch repair protein MutS [Ruminococcus flavefaciens]
MEIDRSKISPMMQQYFEVKDKYKDCILFFRLGDFYEMFFDDAVIVSKALELTLTGRDCGLEERAPMCGVPYHAADMYIKRLIDMGFKVAVCEQLTDPAETKGIVVRDVIRVVTPGTLTESSMLDDGRNNYICSIFYDEENHACGVASADISTGEAALSLYEGKDMEAGVINELSRCQPAEIIFPESFLSMKTVAEFVKVRLDCAVTLRDSVCFSPEQRRDIVTEVFGVDSVSMLGISENGADCAAVCGLFDYIRDTQKTSVSRFTSIELLNGDAYMGLDLNARRNLELTETLRNKEKKGSLLWVLDSTKTS